MARINRINSRNYKEPFLLIKVKEQETMGLLTKKNYYNKLIYASIMRDNNLSTDRETRTDQDKLSIKFLKVNFEININDFVYRNGRIYTINTIDADQYNKQEQKITCTFLSSLEEDEDLKNYLAEVEELKEVNKEFNKYLTKEDLEQELAKKENQIPEWNTFSLIKKENGVISFKNLEEELNELNNLKNTLANLSNVYLDKEEAQLTFLKISEQENLTPLKNKLSQLENQNAQVKNDLNLSKNNIASNTNRLRTLENSKQNKLTAEQLNALNNFNRSNQELRRELEEIKRRLQALETRR